MIEELYTQRFLMLHPKDNPQQPDIVLNREEIKHPLDPDKRYWVVSSQCWWQLWWEGNIAPGTENNLMYLHRELR